jgi:nucleotide-binding universal stress UspA family protein
VSHGGSVHLLHVNDPHVRENERAEVVARLNALVPRDTLHAGIETLVEVTSDESAARSICQVAERVGADAICMGTRGRSEITAALLGSQAQRVVAEARQLVCLVPPERAV